MLTTVLAIWGAILSTALATWNIYKDIRDRGHLRVEAYLHEWYERDEGTGDNIRKYDAEIIVTNIGRRAVVVRSVGVGSQKGWRLSLWRKLPTAFRLHRTLPNGFLEFIFSENALPKKLDPSEFISIQREQLFFLAEGNYVLFVQDSLGRYFLLPKAAMERMKRNYNPEVTHTITVGHTLEKARR